MTTITKKPKLFDFIRESNEDELEILYAVPSKKNILEDEILLTEINERVIDLKSGKVKGITWDEVQVRVKNQGCFKLYFILWLQNTFMLFNITFNFRFKFSTSIITLSFVLYSNDIGL